MPGVMLLLAVLLISGTAGAASPLPAPAGVVNVPAGKFTPLFGFGKKEKREYSVQPFRVDRTPVTRKQFLSFVAKNPQWSKKNVDPLYADGNYLRNMSAAPKKARYPITNVSWFSAQAYCEFVGGRLPTVLEWEFIASASETQADASRDEAHVEAILQWYAKPGNNQGERAVGSQAPNFYGVQDLHGLIWEWTGDFNSVFVSGDNRQDGDKSTAAVCGGGATDASSRSDYAAFMRYAMRSSVEARFAQPNLGFRCAYDKR